MGRKHPRFLYCESINTKSEGPFVIHALPPRFISKLEFDKKRNITDVIVLDNWENADYQQRQELSEELIKWFNFSGRLHSNHPKDQILAKLQVLKFLAENREPFTIEQAEEVIKICFPNKTKTINQSHSSYGLKHLLERISDLYTPGISSKYCSNDTIKVAFERQGFNSSPHGPNCYYNISEKDYTNIDELTRR